ncbi:MAG TPA: DUF2585 family protein, partial [Gemmataceae bacterium]|nr:DUF2585 family protein [Gemmataceae bacterium]
LLDPYSFTHILHGLVIAGILTWLAPRVPWPWGVVLAVLVEALWELIENSPFIIERYRSTTASLGYTGDSVGNSLGDILSGACGYILARWLGGTSGGAPWASSRLLQPQRLLSCGASPRASAPLCRFTSPPAHACVV